MPIREWLKALQSVPFISEDFFAGQVEDIYFFKLIRNPAAF